MHRDGKSRVTSASTRAGMNVNVTNDVLGG